MKPFIRQVFPTYLLTSKSPITYLPSFMVGEIQKDIYGIEDLVVDLNNAKFGWPTDTDISTLWDFCLIRNIDQDKPTVGIYAIPKTNQRCAGFYLISAEELEIIIATWHKTQGVIATFIEGWLLGKSRKK